MDACGMMFCRAFAVSLLLSAVAVSAEKYETANFVVTAANTETARAVGEAAEVCRSRLAEHWLGRRMPKWSRPCRVSVNVGSMGAGGSTTFQFVNGEVLNWRMNLQGSLERILDSVLPHEVNHTVFASYFRRPLPRWADEGAATLFEHSSEQRKQLHLLQSVIENPRERYSLTELLSMKEYPEDARRMLILYAQGYALADFLVQQGGRTAYLKFLGDAETGGWEGAIRDNFDHAGVELLEKNWLAWIRAGMPRLNHGEPSRVEMVALQPVAAGTVLQSRVSGAMSGGTGAVIRSQTPETREKAGKQTDAGGLETTGSERSADVKFGGSRERSGLPGYRDFRLQAPVPRRPAAGSAGALSVPPRAEFEPTMHRGMIDAVSRPGSRGGIEPSPQWAGFPGQKHLF